MRNKRTVALVAALAFVAAVAGCWFYFQSRVLNVWVYTDYAFRFKHPDWTTIITSRFREVNRIYLRNSTGVRWKVLDSSQIDPTSDAPGLDSRRATMALHFDKPADIYVILTGVHEGARTGSVSPFTRVAVVVDFPNKSESANARLLAHELAHLFGAPHDPAWLETVMGSKPESNRFSQRTVALIRRMRNYPFALGIDGLSQDSWQEKALAAVAEDDTAPNVNRSAHAHLVVGTALLNERKREAAIDQFRLAVQADPQDELSRLDLIEAYTRDGQEDRALEEIRQVVKSHPGDPLVHRGFGVLLARAHQPEAALQELQLAARLDPNNPQNKVLLGMALANTFGHIDDAIDTLQGAVRLNPDSLLARQGLEKTQLLKQRVSDELAKERELLLKNPKDADASYRLAKAEERAGDLQGAIRDFQRSAELRPSSGTPHMELAELYLVTGDSNTAWAEVRKARALGAEPPQSLLSRLPPQK